jgi:hypothetical protein
LDDHAPCTDKVAARGQGGTTLMPDDRMFDHVDGRAGLGCDATTVHALDGITMSVLTEADQAALTGRSMAGNG